MLSRGQSTSSQFCFNTSAVSIIKYNSTCNVLPPAPCNMPGRLTRNFQFQRAISYVNLRIMLSTQTSHMIHSSSHASKPSRCSYPPVLWIQMPPTPVTGSGNLRRVIYDPWGLRTRGGERDEPGRNACACVPFLGLGLSDLMKPELACSE